MATLTLWKWLHSETSFLVHVNIFYILDPYLRDLFAPACGVRLAIQA